MNATALTAVNRRTGTPPVSHANGSAVVSFRIIYPRVSGSGHDARGGTE